MIPLTPLSLVDAAAALPDLWSPRILAELNGQYLKVARVHGTFPWHTHDGEDELFLVLRGILTIGRAASDGGPVEVPAGQFFVVPRGLRHYTAAAEETLIALFEPVATAHTGAEQTPQTRTLAEQLGRC